MGVSTVEETRTEAQAQQQRQTHTFQGKGASKAFRTGAKASETETGSRCRERRVELVNQTQNNRVKRQKGDIFKKAKALDSTKRLVCAK